MTTSAIAWAWEKRLPPTEKLVLLWLADDPTYDGSYGSVPKCELAAFAGVRAEHVNGYLKSLAAHGVIKIQVHWSVTLVRSK